MDNKNTDMSPKDMRLEVATYLPIIVPLGRQAIDLSDGLSDAIAVLGGSRLFGGRDLAIKAHNALAELVMRWKEGLDDAAGLAGEDISSSFGPGGAARAAADIVGERVDAEGEEHTDTRQARFNSVVKALANLDDIDVFPPHIRAAIRTLNTYCEHD